MPSARQTDDSDLSLIGQAIRRRIWIVVICFAAATLAAIALTARAEKEYSATTTLLLRISAEVEPQRVVDTNLQLLSLPEISARVAEGLPNVSSEEVSAAISASQQGESDIIRLTATISDPGLAARIANAYAEEFIAFRKGSRRQQPGQVEIVERATPSSTPVSPKPVRNVVFGALIGLVLGIGLALLLEQLDRRIKRQDDLAEATGLQLLATVPKRKSFDGQHLGHIPLSPAEMEVFRMLRANLRYFKTKRDVTSVLVTSAAPGEGKTLVSLGLALAAVTSGEHALLLEADLRDPGLSRVLGLPQIEGLTGVLTGGEKIAATATSIRAGDLAQTVGDASLDVLGAGGIPPNSTELIESQRMKDVLTAAEGAYDFVVVDTPPLLAVSDAIPLLSSVGGVLVVSGLGVSTRGTATELAEQLTRLGAPTLGLVANFAEGTGRSYEGYGYGRAPNLGVAHPRS